MSLSHIPLIEDGVILIDKPPNMTSFGVVARVRKMLSMHFGKKMKVGHTGTLDPFATGLMILVVGKECKKAQHYSKLDKIYEATITLGATSTTGDPEGEIHIIDAQTPSRKEVTACLKEFQGRITQSPPIFSAIKINGQRAYKLARAGKAVSIPKREVEIYSIRLIDYSYPLLKIHAHVSSGTYIRTLAENIGTKLETGAYCSELRRTNVGKYGIENAHLLPM